MKTELFYKNGKKDGLYRQWKEDGSIFVKVSYEDGVRVW